MVHALTSRRHLHCTVELLAIVALAFALSATPAQALGPTAPPRITFAAAWVNTFSTNAFVSSEEGNRQLYVDVGVEIPSGDVPSNVQSVTVTLPDGVTRFDIPKASNDLSVNNEYFRNLTQAGVTGIPTGTYTFIVTDTAGGVTTTTDTLATTAGLTPTTSIVVSGAVQVSSSPGEHFSLDLAANPTPTVTWAPVAGAAFHRLRVRPFGGPDVFVHTVTSSTTTSSTLPAGVMVAGRLYRFGLDAESSANGLPGSDALSRREIRVITKGPELILSGSGGTAAGQTETISARVVNTGPPVAVNVFCWLGSPDGSITTVLTLNNVTIPNSTALQSNNFFNGPIFTKTFVGAEPAGNYIFGARLTDPSTGETIAQSSFRFQK